MTYAAMMVHIDAERPSEHRVKLAVDVARRFGTALIGVAGWSPGLGFGVGGAAAIRAIARTALAALGLRPPVHMRSQ